MEMNPRRRSRGFVKGKLMPFYKAMKPASSNGNNVQYSSSTTTSYVRQHDSNNYVTSSAQPPNVSFLVQAPAGDSEKKLNLLAQKLFGRAVGADESIDVRAATYISSVQERFKLERLNSERLTVLNLDDNDD